MTLKRASTVCSSYIPCCASDAMSNSKTTEEEKSDEMTYKVPRTGSPAEEEEELRKMNDV